MKKTQTARKKKFTTLIIIPKQQNLSKKEIPPPYSTKKKGNQNTTQYQKCANPVYRALYSQAIKLKQTLSTHQNTIKNLVTALKVSAKKAAQNERNIAVLTKQLEKISGTVTTIIRTKMDLYIFCKRKKNKTQDQTTNTDGNLVPVTINKIIPYRNLEKIRRSYDINNQNPYFFIQEKLPPGTVIHHNAGY
jgi:hypothetical protein